MVRELDESDRMNPSHDEGVAVEMMPQIQYSHGV
jgi:hypothetical protein